MSAGGLRVSAFKVGPDYVDAGHLIAERIALAGGEEVQGGAGEGSFRVTGRHIIEARPAAIPLVPCGHSVEAGQREFADLPKPAGRDSIPAVRSCWVHARDPSSYFSCPGPRAVRRSEARLRSFVRSSPKSFLRFHFQVRRVK